jgi:FixJ family two-component response regulator
MTPTVHVVEDDTLAGAALARLLEASGYKPVLYESANLFLDRLPSEERGCILLDLLIPGLNGLELQERLLEIDYLLPIVFLSSHGDVPSTVRAMKGGAEDFLCKPARREDICVAIERALQRYDEARSRRDRMEGLRASVAALTTRERQVFELMVRGKLNKQIGHQLGTSERTIKAHRHAIMEKLAVRSLAEAVSVAERLGMIDDRDD